MNEYVATTTTIWRMSIGLIEIYTVDGFKKNIFFSVYTTRDGIKSGKTIAA